MKQGEKNALAVGGILLVVAAVAVLFVHENGKQSEKTTRNAEGESVPLFV